MKYKLGKNVTVGNKILLNGGWAKITEVREDGVEVSDNFIEFGSEIYGWKLK